MKNWLIKLQNFTLPAERPWQRLLWNVGSALMGGLLLTFGVLIAATHSLAAVGVLLGSHTAAILWSTLFFALLSLALGLLTGRLCWGYLPVALFFWLFTTANYFKTIITAMPLQLYDLALITEVGAIADLNSHAINFSWILALSALLPLLWFVFLLVFSKKLFVMRRKWSLCTALSSAALFLLLFVLLADPLIYAPAGVSLEKRVVQGEVYEKTFAPLGVWRSILYRDTHIPAADQSDLASIVDRIDSSAAPTKSPAPSSPKPSGSPAPSAPGVSPPPADEDPVPPNVIVILSESFFDVTRLEQLHFDRDVMERYHALQEESVSGKFYSRTLGYGTCNIEIEVLTGINNQFLAYGDDPLHWNPADLGAFTPVPAMMRSAGYYTSFLHMFNDSIYGRTQMFSHMGFDEMFFPSDFGAVDPEAAAAEAQGKYWDYINGKISGEFCSDDYMTDLLIGLYEQKGEDAPVFLYAASMENHTPHVMDKYPGYEFSFTGDTPLSDAAKGTVFSYTQGSINAVDALCKLIDYFRQVDEPTLIVFYGDHRPGMGLDSGGSVYAELGIHDGSIFGLGGQRMSELYSSDYLIWANDPSLLPAEPGTTDAHTSPVFLGLEAMTCARIPLTRWWTLISELNERCLAYNEYYFVTPDGQPLDEPEDPDDELFAQIASALADAKGKKLITAQLNEVP